MLSRRIDGGNGAQQVGLQHLLFLQQAAFADGCEGVDAGIHHHGINLAQFSE